MVHLAASEVKRDKKQAESSTGIATSLLSPSIVPLKVIEYGFGKITIRSPYTPYSIYLRGTITVSHLPAPESSTPCPGPCQFRLWGDIRPRWPAPRRYSSSKTEQCGQQAFFAIRKYGQ